MTISYTLDVSQTNFKSFLRLLFRWRGSVWKAVLSQLVAWTLLFLLISFVYRYALTTPQQLWFEALVKYLDSKLDSNIPLTFMLGFFVSFVVARWQSILSAIGWIDDAAILFSTYIRGGDERVRILRRNLVRYMVLSQALVLRDISMQVRKRFPTLDTLAASGLMTEEEADVLDGIHDPYSRYWAPIQWSINIIYDCKTTGTIDDYYLMSKIVEEINKFRHGLASLLKYDWVPVPLVYPQVIFLSVRVYFVICLIGRQFLVREGARDDNPLNIWLPITTMVQFIVYMGWMKVAEALLNPMGEDDDDLECNYIIDKNLVTGFTIVDEPWKPDRTGYAIVEEGLAKIPTQKKDEFWGSDKIAPLYALESAERSVHPLLGSAAKINLVKKKEEIVMTPHKNKLSEMTETEQKAHLRRVRVVDHNESHEKMRHHERQNSPDTALSRIRDRANGKFTRTVQTNGHDWSRGAPFEMAPWGIPEAPYARGNTGYVNGDNSGCIPRAFTNGTVCVCNSTYCDSIEPIGDVSSSKVVLYRTDNNGSRMDRSIIDFSTTAAGPVFTFDPSSLLQEIFGFGGAFTDAAGINMNLLSEQTQHILLQQYFGPSGSEYTLGRVPMASTDFSTSEYSYDDVQGDLDLVNFTLANEDFLLKIPYIQQAISMQNGSGGLRLFASPWSAPGWMKTNNDMKGGGQLRGLPLGPYWITWANYFVKFFEAYANEGIPFWGATVQNEPTTGADQAYPWQTMYFSAQTERDFIKTLLGPALRNSSVSKDILIMTLDDQRFMLPSWADVVFEDEEASSYTSGVAVHWYEDHVDNPDVLTHTHERHPDKFILPTEACLGWLKVDKGVNLGSFRRGEDYAFSIITDMNNYAVGWTDWNLVLDQTGGPTWVSNFVDSPIIVNPDADEFFKQPMYYALAHFSKFLKPGSYRVAMTGPEGLNEDVRALTAIDTAGRRVVVAINRREDEDVTLSFVEKGKANNYVNINLPAHSIITAIWNA